MKLKELESLLQDVKPFERPKVELEQYPTGPHLAACMLYTIENAHNDLEGKTVIDLGSGTGMLSVGCALLGASHVVALELDPDALQQAVENVEQFDEPLPIDFVQCDVLELLPPVQGSSSADPGSGRAQQRQGRQRAQHTKHAGRGAGGRQAARNNRTGRGRRAETESEDESETGSESDSEGEDEDGDTGEQGGPQQEQRPGDDNEEEEDGKASRSVASAAKAQPSLPGPAQPSQPSPAPACWPMPPLAQLCADTVVMNPPFGTKAKGVDMQFLRAAFLMCRGCVYSLHKSSTRAHIHTVATKQLGARHAAVLAELSYDLPATMKFHKQKSVDVQVDLWRFEVGPKTP